MNYFMYLQCTINVYNHDRILVYNTAFTLCSRRSRDNRGVHRDKFFDSIKICHGSHGGNEKHNGP